ncbi:MAG TPA: flavin reductase family protein [Hyphomicrobiales bacterium]|nr:flavin reductase family protein [Rhodobiaceae bacterium]HXK53890.1 flavin reductase family protein [Hyphomicrobiales bacterium]
MFYDAVKGEHGLAHNPFKAIIAPRPIGWISTISRDGHVNLAPYSFFNGICDTPPMVMFASSGRKDSIRNCEETGEFVCNLATLALKDQMNRSSAPVAHDVDEFKLAGLTAVPSRMVAPPRVGESPAALECKLLDIIHLADIDGRPADQYMALGQVIGVYIDDAVIRDGMIDVAELQTLARLGYMDYTAVRDKFAMTRPVE